MARSGSVDPAIRKGMFHRCANPTKPYLNSRDGVAPAYRLMNNNASSASMERVDDGWSGGSHDNDEGWD